MYSIWRRSFSTAPGAAKLNATVPMNTIWVNSMKEAREYCPVPLHYSRNMGGWYGICRDNSSTGIEYFVRRETR